MNIQALSPRERATVLLDYLKREAPEDFSGGASDTTISGANEMAQKAKVTTKRVTDTLKGMSDNKQLDISSIARALENGSWAKDYASRAQPMTDHELAELLSEQFEK